MNKRILCLFVFFLALFLIISLGYPNTIEIHVVYTNDIHDHIRPGYSGQGGMPYVAGFIKNLKGTVENVLVVDAGDLTDKGDMVADYTDGEMMFTALEKIGYNVITLGNHDLDKGIARLCELKELAPSVYIITTNWKEGIEKCFEPSAVVELDGYKIGFIGVVKLEGSEEKVISASFESLKKAISELKKRNCNFIIALCHLSSKSCVELSKKLPEIGLFVSGHTHELLRNPKECEDTGAIIVQAGMYALWVGYIKLEIDTTSGRVVNYVNKIVDLKHSEIEQDEDFSEWVKNQENKICPIANKHLIGNNKELTSAQIAVIACRSLLQKSKADIALFHPRLLVRSTLPKGNLDYNAIYTTAGHRAKEVGIVSLKGRDIIEYLENLVKYGWGRTVWDGFEGLYLKTFPLDKVEFKSNLELDKEYEVVVTRREWENRLKRSLLKGGYTEESLPQFRLCDFTYFDAVSEFIEKISRQGLTLDAYFDMNTVPQVEEVLDNSE